MYIHNAHVAVSIDFLTRISELPDDEAETEMINGARQSAAEMVNRGVDDAVSVASSRQS